MRGRLLGILAAQVLWCTAAFAQHNSRATTNTVVPPPAIQPFRMPQSIGLSPRSIGLSPPSIGLSPSPVFGTSTRPIPGRAPVKPGDNHGRNGRRDHIPALGLFGLPYFGPPYVATDTLVPSAPDTNTADLSEQIQRLGAQLRDLQNQLTQSKQADTAAPAPPEEQAPAAPVVPITLVLKDGTTLRTASYAVVGNTFWDLANQPARKVPLDRIDIAASEKATDAAGAELPPVLTQSQP